MQEECVEDNLWNNLFKGTVYCTPWNDECCKMTLGKTKSILAVAYIYKIPSDLSETSSIWRDEHFKFKWSS